MEPKLAKPPFILVWMIMAVILLVLFVVSFFVVIILATFASDEMVTKLIEIN